MSAPEHVMREIEQALVCAEAKGSEGSVLAAYRMRSQVGAELGYVFVQDRANVSLCADDLVRLAQYQPVRGARAVFMSNVDRRYRGLGVGSKLYEAALLDAAKEGLALVPDSCTPGGETSAFAQRVWDKLKASYVHEGNVVFGVRKRGRR